MDIVGRLPLENVLHTTGDSSYKRERLIQLLCCFDLECPAYYQLEASSRSCMSSKTLLSGTQV
jgi:hypothetical protein